MANRTIDDLNRTVSDRDNSLQSLRREYENLQHSAQEMIDDIDSKRRQTYEELLQVKSELENTVAALADSRSALGTARQKPCRW